MRQKIIFGDIDLEQVVRETDAQMERERKAAREAQRKVQQVTRPEPVQSNISSRFSLDPVAVKNAEGNHIVVDQQFWIEYWKGIPGKVFASAADYYTVLEQIDWFLAHGTPGNGQEARAMQRVLGEDCRNHLIITSTRIEYQGRTGIITHHYDTAQEKTTTLVIPEYLSVPVDTLLGKGIEPFLRALFATDNNGARISALLALISQRDPILLLTPPIPEHRSYTSRSEEPVRVVGFSYSSAGFHISAAIHMGSEGISRGIRL